MLMKKRNFISDKKGSSDLLQEYIIFIVLNLVFLSVIIGFLIIKSNNASVLEQSYAKNIALLIDASVPTMEMKISMEQAFNHAEKKNIPRDEIVKIVDNNVTVNLGSNIGYSYSFFNDVDVSVYADIYPNKNYIIKINGYK